MNRRDFLKGLGAAAAVIAVPFQWIGKKIHDVAFLSEVSYWDRRLSDEELEQMSRGVFPEGGRDE